MAKRRNVDVPLSRTQPSYLAEHVITNDHTLINGGRVDDTQFDAAPSGRKYIPGGTLMGRTDDERFWGPWASGDTEVYLSIYDIEDALVDDDVALLLGGFQIYHMRLPGWADLPAATQTLIREKYVCLRGLTV